MLSAILVAAGSSRRMGLDKLLASIAGKPVIAHTITAFQRAHSVSEIIIVAREDRHREIEKIVRDENLNKVRSIVAGGEHRHDSVHAGLSQISAEAKYVAVHDAARPLVTPEQIERVFEKCRQTGAATLAEPISDTIKRVDVDLLVSDSVDRRQLYAMQTPQIFERSLLEEAYRAVEDKKVSVTDEVSAVELLRRKVALVVNEDLNFKITYPRDLPLADFVLRQRGASA
ncbi:MAG: 2-C-methyl-D-erythritol 4-phosphate cytidylyltransferase [Verrucomicrobiota bacterium]